MREFAPAFFVNFDAEFLSGCFDAFPGRVAVGIRNVLHLIKACNRVANMSRVTDRFFFLFWECVCDLTHAVRVSNFSSIVRPRYAPDPGSIRMVLEMLL